MEATNHERQKARRGFAAMSPERQREIASQGGRAAHVQGVAHEWSREEAKEAGRKGGRASGDKRKSQRDEDSPRP
jgi:general stress protein YciG